ncbi:MAG TPA: Hsp20/alpha crystallin family protein [Patescibacteria group bacterium]|nr:Hsp20/alpha crystallin family protein [Patescibacteria group bacterium]
MQLIRREPISDLATWSPFQSLFDDFFRMPGVLEDGLTGSVRAAATDVYETGDDVVVKMAVPGIKPEDINIQVSGDTLNISGESKDEAEDKGKNYYQRQLRYGRFAQSIVLPAAVQSEKAEATFRNGMLTLTLPKSEEARPKQIKVKVEDETKKLN